MRNLERLKLQQIVYLNQNNSGILENKMSVFCDSASQSQNINEMPVDEFSFNIFSSILESRDGLRLSANQFVLTLPNHKDKVVNGTTLWSFSHKLQHFSIQISFQLRNMNKMIEKRLSDILNKEFKLSKIIYQKPKITLNYNFSMQHKMNSYQLYEKEIKNISINLTEVIQRIEEIQNQQEKLEPFMDLYSMRECFQFKRGMRENRSPISLKLKKNKNVSEVNKLLIQGDTTLNKLEQLFISEEIKKYNDQKAKIQGALQSTSDDKKNKEEKNILTSIDILKVDKEEVITFKNQQPSELLSIISKGSYTFKKEITIHKESELQSLSSEIFTSVLIKKQKTEYGSDQFDNEVKLLTHLKGTYHRHIAEYYCKLQESPFKSNAFYVQYYKSSLSAVKSTLTREQKLKILHQIAKVLTFLSYRKICHRDLKMDNIMIDKDLDAKVIDWGSVCSMYSRQKDPGALKVKSQRLFSTQGYYQRYYEDIFNQTFGHKFTREQIDRGQFFDIYSFGLIIRKFFDLDNSNFNYWLDAELNYLTFKCREKNPCDRLTAIEVEIYLALLRKKISKLEKSVSLPIASSHRVVQTQSIL